MARIPKDISIDVSLPTSSPEWQAVHPEKLDKKFEKQKWEILKHYVRTGSFLKTAKEFGLEQRWIKGWAVSEEGKEFIEEYRAELNIEVQAELLDTARKAAGKANERLEKGNTVILKDGTEVSKNVDAGEASAVASRLLDAKIKLDKNQKESTSIEKRDAIIQRLLKVQEQLVKAANINKKPIMAKTIVEEPIEVEATEVASGT